MESMFCACLLLMTLQPISSQFNSPTKVIQGVVSSILSPFAYDKRVRPREANYTTTVGIQLNLLTINDLDPVTETLITTAWLHVVWFDDRLVWEVPIDGVDTVINVPQDEVWRPDISLKNSYSDLKPLGNKYMHVLIATSGIIGWYPYHVFQSNCDLDTRHFPFDVQTCELQFSAWSFVSGQVNFGGLQIALTNYQSSNHFDLTNYTAEERIMDNSSVAVFRFELKRKPLFVVMTIVIPTAMLALLSTCVFILPFESGEKISYSVTVFLAFMVSLTYVSTILPENSDSVSYLALYVTSQVTQSTLQTFITILLCRCYHFNDDERTMPKVLVFLANIFCLSKKQKANHDLPRTVTVGKNESNRRIAWERKRSSYSSTNLYFDQKFHRTDFNNDAYAYRWSSVDLGRRNVLGDSIATIPERDYSIDDIKEESDDEREKVSVGKGQVTWTTLVNGLDAFCFVFFLLSSICCTTLFFTASALGI